jgi:hypothetical protein
MPQRPLKMTTARAEKLFSIDIVDAPPPPPLPVEAVAQPPLAAIAPEPPGEPNPWRRPRVGKCAARCAFARAHRRRSAPRLGARSGDRSAQREATHGKLKEAAGAGSAAGRATAQ